MDHIAQYPDSLFFLGIFGMYFSVVMVSAIIHKFFH